MKDCKKCSLITRSVVVALIGIAGLIMFIFGGVGISKAATDTVEHYAEFTSKALLMLSGVFIMVISCLLPCCCVIECGDGVQKKLGIRKEYTFDFY